MNATSPTNERSPRGLSVHQPDLRAHLRDAVLDDAATCWRAEPKLAEARGAQQPSA